MHDHRLLTEARLERFIRERLTPATYRATHPLTVTAWHAEGEPVSFAHALAQEFHPFPIGSAWGRPWSTTWMRVTGEIPDSWRDEAGNVPEGLGLEMVVDLGFNKAQTGFQSEALVYGLDGAPIKAISPHNAYVRRAVDSDGRVDVFLEAAGNPDVGSDWLFVPTALGDLATSGSTPLYELRQVDVALLDETVWELQQDVRVLSGLMQQLPVDQPRRAQILAAFEDMMTVIDPHDVAGTAAAGRRALAGVLAKPAAASSHILHAMGHAHIDSAWLWPVRETIRKCARTFSNMVTLMDENPDFTFACSSAQQFAWVKEFYPALFERIREKVAAGQFLPVGGMWVEADTNLPGSEAMARQFVLGKQFFLEEFGVECEEAWLPDSFGYSGALPQIVKAAGSKWFLTQKISWNDTNVMPHHTFLWEGIDGTRLFTHFPPVDKYNSDLSAEDIAYAEKNFLDKGRATVSLMPYGYGDGGGGTTREMVATRQRTESLEGSPRLIASTSRIFFETAEAEYPAPPVWSGELYLEAQRGTYTSQLATKQGNRRSEHLLREAELWAATAAVRLGSSYPYDELTSVWQTVLLQQFHDILPGSSIAWVHQDAERNYGAVAAILTGLVDEATRALAGTGESAVVFNAAPHDRAGIPALSARVDDAEASSVAPTEWENGLQLDNGLIRVRFDRSGLIVSILEHESGREVVPPGARSNLFQLHRDTPTMWDAWDIDLHYRDVVEDLVGADSVEASSDGRGIVITRSFGLSTIRQVAALRTGSRQLDFVIDVDWHEKQKLLKLAFPVDVRTSRFSSEIQFGHIERPTHSNTSWDEAKFETSAHRWVRLEDGTLGVGILNDSTYGYDVTSQPRQGGGTMTVARLSILRAPLYPDPQQDQGSHRLRVSVVVGSLVDTIAGGYHLNLERRTVVGASSSPVEPLVTVDNPGVVVESVKLAEDRSGDVVVRLYEALGQRAEARVVGHFATDGVVVTDLLEREIPDDESAVVDREGLAVDLRLRPFQIVTLRFARRRSA